MALDVYVAACCDQIIELKSSLSPEDIRELAIDYGALLSKPWVDWVQEHEAEIISFVSAAPSARRAKRAWQDPVVRRRLTLASIFHIQQAELLLHAVFRMDLTPGRNRRDMAARAGEAYNRVVFDHEVPLWPFDQHLELVAQKA